MLSFFVSKWYVVDFTLQVVTSKTTRSNRKVVNKANPFSLGHGSVAQTQMLAAIIRYIKVAGVRGEDGRLMSSHWTAADGTVGNPLQRQADGWWINATLISIASASGVPEGVRISSKSNHNAAATRAAITNVPSMNWSANSRIPSSVYQRVRCSTLGSSSVIGGESVTLGEIGAAGRPAEVGIAIELVTKEAGMRPYVLRDKPQPMGGKN